VRVQRANKGLESIAKPLHVRNRSVLDRHEVVDLALVEVWFDEAGSSSTDSLVVLPDLNEERNRVSKAVSQEARRRESETNQFLMFDGAEEDLVARSNARTASIDRGLAADPSRSFVGHDEGSARRGNEEKWVEKGWMVS
jgi:predicted transcriptional regulator